jgi:hypothetical protein
MIQVRVKWNQQRADRLSANQLHARIRLSDCEPALTVVFQGIRKVNIKAEQGETKQKIDHFMFASAALFGLWNICMTIQQAEMSISAVRHFPLEVQKEV